MVEETAIPDLFSQVVASARTKLLIRGSFGVSINSSMDRLRSLNLEHVSPTDLIRHEISRHSSFGANAERDSRFGREALEGATLFHMRKWFWTRKPDAGFLLSNFPATLLQAKVFDEWLDARDELLSGLVLLAAAPADPVVDHYRTLGLSFIRVPRSDQ